MGWRPLRDHHPNPDKRYEPLLRVTRPVQRVRRRGTSSSGRQWWMFLVWFFGIVFYATNVIQSLGTFLAIAGVLTNAWLLIILADYFICRRWLRLGRMEGIEFREDEVRAWNPC